MHEKKSELAGKVVKIKPGIKHFQVPDFGGSEFKVEDWWDRIAGKSWVFCTGNPACLVYAMRAGIADEPIPMDNEVLYGKVGHLGHLVHVSEIDTNEIDKAA